MELDNDVARLRILKSEHDSQHYRLEDSLLKHYPRQIKAVTERIECIESDVTAYSKLKEKCVEIKTTNGAASVTTKFPGMTIDGVTHTEKEPAAKALLEFCTGITDKNEKAAGEYMGFKLAISFDTYSKQYSLFLRGHMTYQIELGTDAFGNITRINNALDNLGKQLDGQRAQLENLNTQMAAAKEELAKPFPQEQELISKETRLVLLNADLNIDGDGGMDVLNDAENREESDERQPQYDEARDDDEDEPDVPLPRTGTYNKSAPSFLENIKNLGSRKQETAPTISKPNRIEI